MCGVGCGSDSDCQGGGNPCTLCSSRRVCINPVPSCGTFCGNYDGACRFNSGECGGFNEECCTCHPTDMNMGCGNHTITSGPSCGSTCKSSADCVNAPSNCTYCVNQQCSQQQDVCGTVCSSSGQCLNTGQCPQCVGYYCSPKATCGQVCLSSGQCQSNPGNCKACVGTICTQSVSCGGACGSDDWCGTSCPVCSYPAKCSTHSTHNQWLSSASQQELTHWHDNMATIRTQEREKNLLRHLGGRMNEIL